MSIHVINQGTRTKRGGGLPFYESLDFVFSKINKDFNSTIGLWEVPIENSPSFQIWAAAPYLQFEHLLYLETKGCNDFTGLVFTASGNLTKPIVPVPVKADGVQYYVYELSNSTYSIVNPVAGRYLMELKVSNGAGSEKLFFSEEFVIKPCCG